MENYISSSLIPSPHAVMNFIVSGATTVALVRSILSFVPLQSSGAAGHSCLPANAWTRTAGAFLKMPLVGSFEVHESVDDSTNSLNNLFR